MTAGILSGDGTAIALFPFSNSIGFHPDRTKKAQDPFGSTRHQGDTRCRFSTWVRSVLLDSSPNGAGVVGMVQEQLLLLQTRDDVCAMIERWVRADLGESRECQGFESSHFILHRLIED
jgi:hypothetical protein